MTRDNLFWCCTCDTNLSVITYIDNDNPIHLIRKLSSSTLYRYRITLPQFYLIIIVIRSSSYLPTGSSSPNSLSQLYKKWQTQEAISRSTVYRVLIFQDRIVTVIVSNT